METYLQLHHSYSLMTAAWRQCLNKRPELSPGNISDHMSGLTIYGGCRP
jgi:hypothetical protein